MSLRLTWIHGCRKDFFQGGDKNGEISFYSLETKRTTFFAKNVTGKCQALCRPSDGHCLD